MRIRTLAFIAIAALVSGGSLGCREEGPAEKLGRQLDEAGQDAGDAFEEAGDALEDAGDALEGAAEETKKKLSGD